MPESHQSDKSNSDKSNSRATVALVALVALLYLTKRAALFFASVASCCFCRTTRSNKSEKFRLRKVSPAVRYIIKNTRQLLPIIGNKKRAKFVARNLASKHTAGVIFLMEST